MSYPQSDSFDLQVLELTAKDGQVFDISGIYIDIDISESTETPFLQGNVLIRDTELFIEQILPDGTETLRIKFRSGRMAGAKGKASKVTPIEHVFRVTGVRAAEKTKPGETIYAIDIVSEDFITNLSKQVSRSFSQRQPHEIVAGLLQTDIESEAEQFLNESLDKVTYVAPFSAPFEIIGRIAKGTKYNGTSDVLFFRNNRGYVLESMSELIDNPKHSHEFYETPEGTPASSHFEYLNSVEDVYPVDYITQDYVQGLLTGRYGISMDTYNRTSKTLSYAAETVPVRLYAHDSSSNLIPESIRNRREIMGTRFATPIIFNMGGYSGRAVGDTFLFRRAAGGFVDDFKWSNLYSGTYLITKIAHRIARFEYTNLIEAIKVSDL